MLDRADVLARHRAADHLVDEFKAPAARQRPDLDVHITELAVPAGLALEARVLLGRLADGFLVGGLRARGVDLHIEAALQDRKSVVEGKSVSVRVDLGGRRIIKKKTTAR